MILDIVEFVILEGLIESFVIYYKLYDILNKVVELLFELWKFVGFFYEVILLYRRVLLYNWNF